MTDVTCLRERNMKNYIILVGITMLLLLVGCNASRQVKENTSSSTEPVEEEKAILVVEKPKKPDLPKMKYRGPLVALGGAIGGLIGGAIADESESTEDVLEKYFEKHEIYIDEMLYSTFSKEIFSVSTPIELTDSPSEVKMKIEVKEYGFEKGWGFTKVKPMISLRTKIIDKDGNELFHRVRKVGGATGVTPSNKLEVWVNDPMLVKDGFQQAIDIVVKQTIESLQAYTY